MANLIQELSSAMRGRHPLIYLVTTEEDRVRDALSVAAADVYGEAAAEVTLWNCVDGLGGEAGGNHQDPVAALQAIGESTEPGVVLMKDLAAYLDRPEVVRALRDACAKLRLQRDRAIAVVSPVLQIPPDLEKEVFLIEVGMPGEEELIPCLDAVQAMYPERVLPDALRAELLISLKGLSLNETTHVLHRIFTGETLERETVIDAILDEKERSVRKSGYLEFMPPRTDLSQIGGLENLKEWLLKRKDMFSRKALDAGLPIPKGILLMGVSGCGKSLSAKAISALWNVPLFRLDMNLVFSGMYGTPEATFHNAMKTVEGVAPAVLWIDEIENGLGMEDGKSNTTHIFSSFLTWMQEKPPLVFIAATANRIQSLPAEVIRKGRFDQIFFCDLPNAVEREHILAIHIRNNDGDPGTFKLDYLTMETEGWNGAEIEQAIISARIDAIQEDRAFETSDVLKNTRLMVPLSSTMHEQVKFIRDWAYGRASPASKIDKKGLVQG